ncbi:glycosyl hydrolase family 18 protein [Caulobacter sp. KR2-114]|uniref:glycosyl hydrolase family 18 protein n=1 Tax=Caulobacter sp. KR2-114 TaxID=3400912 RepID=UPI003BFF1F6D
MTLRRLATILFAVAAALGAPFTSAWARAPSGAEVVAFHVPWDPASAPDLAAHKDRIDVFAPQWVALIAADGTLRLMPDPAAQSVLKTAPGVAVMPVVSNAHDSIWDTASASAMLASPAARAKVIARLTTLAKARGWAGYVFDFENLTPAGVAAYPGFVAQARKALGGQGRKAWVTAFLSADPSVLQPLSKASDRLVLMAYDECWSTSTPGPVAGEDWLEQLLPAKLAGLDAGKAMLAVGTYGYDWPIGKPATVTGVAPAQALAASKGAAITHDPASANAVYRYTDKGQKHTVWMTDAHVWAYELAAAKAAGLKGLAIWRLGLEDPAIWTTPAAAAPYGIGNPPAKLPRCFLLGSPWAKAAPQ